MYSDDPGQADESEKIFTDKILDFVRKYNDEEFGLKMQAKDIYEIFSKSGKYKGKIDLNKGVLIENI